MTTSFELFATTVLIAVSSAVLALLVGYPIGYWIASLRQLRRTITAVVLVPFLLPAFLIGIAIRPLVETYVNDSKIGILLIVFAHAFMNAGFLSIVTASSLVPKDQLEAAQLDGASRIQSRLRIALPQQAPALAAATLLVALYSATSYGLVITLGQGEIETLETQIAQSALQELDLQRAGLLALIQTLMTLSFFLIARRLGAKPTVLFGEEQVSADGSRIGAGLGLLLIASAGFVFWSVLSRALFEGEGLLGNLANLSGRGTRDILNLSVTDALGNSVRNLVISASLALAISWLLSKRRAGFWVLIPVGISPVVIGLTALVLSGYLPTQIAGSWLLLPLVQTIFLIPLAYQIIAPARASLSSEMLEAAELDGASGIRLFGLIELPTLARPIGAATALVGLGSLGEFGAASFLAYGSDATLPLVMFRLLSRPGTENLGMAMTAASLLILLAFLMVWVISSVQTERQRP